MRFIDSEDDITDSEVQALTSVESPVFDICMEKRYFVSPPSVTYSRARRLSASERYPWNSALLRRNIKRISEANNTDKKNSDVHSMTMKTAVITTSSVPELAHYERVAGSNLVSEAPLHQLGSKTAPSSVACDTFTKDVPEHLELEKPDKLLEYKLFKNDSLSTSMDEYGNITACESVQQQSMLPSEPSDIAGVITLADSADLNSSTIVPDRCPSITCALMNGKATSNIQNCCQEPSSSRDSCKKIVNQTDEDDLCEGDNILRRKEDVKIFPKFRSASAADAEFMIAGAEKLLEAEKNLQEAHRRNTASSLPSFEFTSPVKHPRRRQGSLFNFFMLRRKSTNISDPVLISSTVAASVPLKTLREVNTPVTSPDAVRDLLDFGDFEICS